MLDLQGVSVAFDKTLAVDRVDLSVADGTVLAVLGPSGCGKSTLLRAVAGLEPLSAGSIAWEGTDLAGTPTHRRGFALMFQDGQLFDHLSVARNVGYAQRLRGLARSEVRGEVDELLALVGLEGYADRLPRTLSGGERQRVALARSLAARPRLLLLDEPLSALDAGLRGRLATDLRRILTASGTTALMVTHDQAEAFAIADRLAVMRDGRIVQEGPTGVVWDAPVDADTALFLGYARVLEGEAAAALLRLADAPAAPGSAVAVRSSAVQAGPVRDGGRSGVVQDFQLTPDGSRVVVTVDGIGDLAGVGVPGWSPTRGDAAAVRVDRRGLAVIPDAQARPPDSVS